MPNAIGLPTVRELRRRWKPAKELLSSRNGAQPTLVRFHRACSWAARAEQLDPTNDLDLKLISLWVAFNALYGQWDEARREPRPDRESWRAFMDRILQLDNDQVVSSSLIEHKALVISLVEDACLSNSYWREKKFPPRRISRKAKSKAQAFYIDNRWACIMDEVLDRVYLVRCQLIHGAATYGGKLNRTSLRRCVLMLERLLPAVLLVWIDHGAEEDWGTMCYSPDSGSRDKTGEKSP